MKIEELKEKLEDFKGPTIFIYFKPGGYSGYTTSSLRIEGEVGREALFNTYGHIIAVESVKDISSSGPIDLNIGNCLGSDPELFFVKDNEVVPSPQVVVGGERVIQDGFQGELNPLSNTCRQVSGGNIGYAFMEALAMAKNAGTEISLKVGHMIGEGAWKNSPLSLKKFGCNPTLNAYESKFKRVTGLREKFRAAGGHIHMGSLTEAEKQNADKVVALMDVFAGNTCVLIDRDPDNARRRKIYGRAGEHRIKSYGIEYRVLSNFWLKHYVLWSFTTALLRNALVFYRLGMYDEIMKRIDIVKVRKAINENDYDLALENFKLLKAFIKEKKPIGQGLDHDRVDKIETWLTMPDPLFFCKTMSQTVTSWRMIMDSNSTPGFEAFIDHGELELDEDSDDEYGDDD